MATSATLRPNTPIWSSGADCISTPRRGIRPKLGLKPTTPQNEAGRITEPLVCVPTPSGTMKAATAAAEPLDEPPGVWPLWCGLRVLPGA